MSRIPSRARRGIALRERFPSDGRRSANTSVKRLAACEHVERSFSQRATDPVLEIMRSATEEVLDPGQCVGSPARVRQTEIGLVWLSLPIDLAKPQLFTGPLVISRGSVLFWLVGCPSKARKEATLSHEPHRPDFDALYFRPRINS